MPPPPEIDFDALFADDDVEPQFSEGPVEPPPNLLRAWLLHVGFARVPVGNRHDDEPWYRLGARVVPWSLAPAWYAVRLKRQHQEALQAVLTQHAAEREAWEHERTLLADQVARLSQASRSPRVLSALTTLAGFGAVGVSAYAGTLHGLAEMAGPWASAGIHVLVASAVAFVAARKLQAAQQETREELEEKQRALAQPVPQLPPASPFGRPPSNPGGPGAPLPPGGRKFP